MEKQPGFSIIEDCLLRDGAPSGRLRAFAREPWFRAFPFSMLLALQQTEQSPVHHPEGNVWEHTMLVVDAAAALKRHSADRRVFLWAALLHDIGKPDVTRIRRGRVTAYDHDRRGAEKTREFLAALTEETAFIGRVAWLVHYHMQPLYVLKNLPFQDIEGMRAHTDVREVALIAYCDRLGRTGADRNTERSNVLLFLNKCNERKDVLRPKTE